MRKSFKKNIEQKINEVSTVHRGWRSKDISDGMCRNANLTAPLQKKRPRCHTRRNTPTNDENTDDTIVMPWWLYINAGQDSTEMNQSCGGLVVKALASHASGRGFDPPGGLSSKNPVGWESECL